MKFPINFFKKNKQEEEVYLGLFLKEQEGMAMFLDFRGGQIETIGQEKFTYTNAWENLTEDIDEALYKLELQTKKSPEKTIFFVYSHLVDSATKQINKPYLHKIKEIVKNLELKPLGYIECHEAVVEHLEKKEEINLTANLIEIDKTSLAVFVYKDGKLIFQETVSRTADIIQDLVPVFDRIKNHTLLPTRIVLYNSRDLDLEVANILTHRWKTDYFIQLPKVDVVKESELIESLLRVFSKQIVSPALQAEEGLKEEKEIMGFVIGGDVKREERESLPVQIRQRRWKFPSFPSLQSLYAPFLSKFNQLKITMPSLLVAGVFLIIIGLFLLEFYLHKASVTIFFPSQSIEKQILIDAYTSKSKAENNLLLKAAAETASIEKKKSATGKREIGEKAKGEVTIHNFDDREKTFETGTVIEAQGIKFLFDNNVKVASSSLAADGSAKLPGKNKVKATAAQIGAESNLSKSQRFKIDELSQSLYFAINDNEFSGGTKKEIKTVSKDDVNSLRNQVLQEADRYQTKKIEPSLGKDFKMLKTISDIKLAKTVYSREIGEEAESLELKASAKISYYYYKNSDILDHFKSNLKKDIKKGLKVESENIRYKINKIEPKKESYTLVSDVNVKATPAVNKQALLKEVRGKRAKNIQETIKKKTQATGLEYTVDHPLVFVRGWMPFFAKNIQLKVSFP